MAPVMNDHVDVPVAVSKVEHAAVVNVAVLPVRQAPAPLVSFSLTVAKPAEYAGSVAVPQTEFWAALQAEVRYCVVV